jgi:hypothetical protein
MSTDLTTTDAWIDDAGLLDAIPGSGELEPGRIQWDHGNNKGRTPGVWYAKSDQLSETPGAPWVEDNDRFENETGYSTDRLKIAFIGWRAQWQIPGDRKAKKPPVWILDYDREVKAQGLKAKKITEFLVMVEGIADPMVISVSGMYKAQVVLDLIKDYERGLLKQASRIFKRQLPRWAFWLPIGNPTKDGKTVYTSAKDAQGDDHGSYVTPPTLYLPADPVRALAVPSSVLVRGAEIRKDFDAWFKAKRTNRDTVETEYTVEDDEPPALPAPAGHNIPSALTDEEMAELNMVVPF